MRLRRSWLFALVVMSLLLVAANPLHAQESEIVLQLAVPGYMEDLFNQGLLGQFEAEHPGVRVELVTSGGAGMVVSVGGGGFFGLVAPRFGFRTPGRKKNGPRVRAGESGEKTLEITRLPTAG